MAILDRDFAESDIARILFIVGEYISNSSKLGIDFILTSDKCAKVAHFDDPPYEVSI